MQRIVQEQLLKDSKMYQYLLLNTAWYKQLNRNPNNYQSFQSFIKKKYQLRPTDKINSALENIDMVSSILEVLK